MTDDLSGRSILAEFFPATFLNMASHGREEEFLQPLIDLGYLEGRVCDPDFIEMALSRDALRGPGAIGLHMAIRQGLAVFRAEATEVGMLDAGLVASDLGEGEAAIVHPGTVEMELLHLLVSLDGEARLGKLPREGDEGLLVRVLQYQLDVYGLFEGKVGQPFGEMETMQLEKLRAWLGLDLLVEVLPLLADSELLADALLNSSVFSQQAFGVAFFEAPFDDFLGMGNGSRAFRDALEKSLDPLRQVAFQKLVAANRLLVVRRLLDAERVAEIADSEVNRFLLRLIQVRQWTRGFYQGKLDSDFGPMSIGSLVEYARSHEDNMDEWLLKSGRAKDGKEYWSINYIRLLEGMKASDGAAGAATLDGLVADFDAGLERLPFNERGKVMVGLGDHFLDFNVNARKNLRMGRRVYYGIRSLVRSISKGLGKIIDFIIKGARAIAQLTKNLAKLLFRAVREALRVFGRGLGFLFSDRTITTQEGFSVAAITKFDFDMDAFNYYNPAIGPEAFRLHQESLRQMVSGLGFSLELTATVINVALGLAAGPSGWIALALGLVRKFASMLRRRRATRLNAAA